MVETETVEEVKDFGKEEEGKVSRWKAEIKAYEETFKDWITRGGDIIERYRDEKKLGGSTGMRFNILWSNIETLKSAVFGKGPKPDVSRRYKDRDPVGLAASVILERCLSLNIDSGKFEQSIKQARDNYLLVGRGQVWLRYVPTFGDEIPERNFVRLGGDDPENQVFQDDAGNEVDGDIKFDDDGNTYVEGDPYRPVVYEEVAVDFLNYKDFGHTPAPTWDKVRAVWKRQLLTREQLVDRFGEEKGKVVKLTKNTGGIPEKEIDKYGDIFKRAEVFEIWDRTDRKVRWVADGHPEFLDEQDDPLNLIGFFPCPRPAYATMTGETLIPVPDFAQYQDQAKQIDIITQRISLLIKAMKVAGAYDASFPKLEEIIKGEENVLVPVDNWALFIDKNGIKGAISFMPLGDVAAALQALMQTRETLKRDLYEISGISDIVRGQQTSSRATATEQRIKGKYATLRLEARQDEMERFARDTLRIMAEVIGEHFAEEMMLMMSGWQFHTMAQEFDKKAAKEGGGDNGMAIFKKAVNLLRSDKLRSCRVDIETDTTVMDDAIGEKKARTEFLQAMSGFLSQALPAAEKYPALAPALVQSLFFGIRAFKAGRELEASFEHAIEDMQQQTNQSSGPDEEKQKAQAESVKAQGILQKAEAELKKIQMNAQADEQEHENRMEEIEAKHAATMEEMAAKEAVADKDREVKVGDQALKALDMLNRDENEPGADT